MPYNLKYASFGSINHRIGQGVEVTKKVKRLLGDNIVIPFQTTTNKDKFGYKDDFHQERKELLIVIIDPITKQEVSGRFKESVNSPWTIGINF